MDNTKTRNFAITEDYVSFETAKLLKEKGFDDVCRTFWKNWYNEKSLCECSSSHCFYYCTNAMLENYNDENEMNIAAPTLQMAMKWLREVYGLFIRITEDITGNVFEWSVYQKNYGCKASTYVEDSYEQACETAIKYCLENLI